MPRLNPDFRDMLSALLGASADFLLVGAQAMAAHGYTRFSADLDIVVRASPENARRVWRAMEVFGAPMFQYRPSDLEQEDMVLQLGVPPRRIDIMTSISGVSFDEAWPRRVHVETDGLSVPIIGLDELIRNKIAAARDKDELDVKQLEKLRRRRAR
jgi:hypothetical protein